MTMRIGIEAQRVLRAKKHGMDVVAVELIKSLQQIDKNNEYVVFARTDKDDNAVRPTENFMIKKIPSFTYADWEQIKLKRAVKAERIDLLHCTANTAPLSISVPLIVTVHDIIYLENIDFKGTTYQNLGNLYRRYVVPKVARRADLLLTVSEFERQNIIEHLKIPEDRVKVLYNGVSPQFHNRYTVDQLLEFKSTYKLPRDFVMFLGNTAPKKNTRNVIKAYVEYCRSDKDALPLVLLDYKRELVVKLLQELDLEAVIEKIIFPGYIPHHVMPLMYSAATLFLYPSLRESFGLPIIEAMACGTPVITSNTSSMPEVAGEAATIVDPFNHLHLADAIKLLAADKALREDYITKGLQRASDFTWTASAAKLIDIYDSLPVKPLLSRRLQSS
jgi:glycosyltransferase involved in cell wall biosynthesis